MRANRIEHPAGCANVPIDLGDAIAPVVVVRGNCLDRLLLQAKRFEVLSRHDCHSERRAAQARCDMKTDFVFLSATVCAPTEPRCDGYKNRDAPQKALNKE